MDAKELQEQSRVSEPVCPNCGAKRKVLGQSGWWQYTLGKWCCDCGAEGIAWYSGKEISRLQEVTSEAFE